MIELEKNRLGRWKAGESGNPGGRKPGTREVAAISRHSRARGLSQHWPQAGFPPQIAGSVNLFRKMDIADPCMFWEQWRHEFDGQQEA